MTASDPSDHQHPGDGLRHSHDAASAHTADPHHADPPEPEPTTSGRPADGAHSHSHDDHQLHARDDHRHSGDHEGHDGNDGHHEHDHDGHDDDLDLQGQHDHGDGDHGHDRAHAHPGGLRGLVASIFRSHSHDAADSIDSTLQANDDGMRALKISLGGLAVTAVIQVVIVTVSGSVALLADTIHNFADALTAVPLAAAFWLSRRPPTRRYTYGYGRSEDLAGIFIVATIAISSAVAAWEAINRLVHPHHVHAVGWVIAAGIVGLIGNETVAGYRICVGRRIGSAALEADGYHARTDGFTSLAVVIGAFGVAIGWQIADPIIGLAITVAILVVVKNAARDIYRRLMDAVDPALVDQVTGVLATVHGIQEVEVVRIRWVGHELRAEADVVSDGSLSLAEAHDVAEHAHHYLLHQVPRLAKATIHTSPSAADGLDPHALTAHHRRSAPDLRLRRTTAGGRSRADRSAAASQGCPSGGFEEPTGGLGTFGSGPHASHLPLSASSRARQGPADATSLRYALPVIRADPISVRAPIAGVTRSPTKGGVVKPWRSRAQEDPGDEPGSTGHDG